MSVDGFEPEVTHGREAAKMHVETRTHSQMVVLTSTKPTSSHPSNSQLTSGAANKLPTRLYIASFHPYSFSLVRAKTRIIKYTMYNEEAMYAILRLVFQTMRPL
jgi:hypothetical protein